MTMPTKPALPEPDTARLLREAVDGVMAHQWSNTRPAMHALQVLIDTAADTATALDAAVAEVRAVPDTLCQQLQQQCSDCGVYWRAPDAHGVNLSLEQAHELLRSALGVEVEIATPSPAEQPKRRTAAQQPTQCDAEACEAGCACPGDCIAAPSPTMPAEQTKPAVREALETLYAAALNAVGHVGASNYAERERKAKQWVRDAYAQALAALSGEQP